MREMLGVGVVAGVDLGKGLEWGSRNNNYILIRYKPE